MLLEDFSFCMVADDSDIDEAAQIQLLRSKVRHSDQNR